MSNRSRIDTLTERVQRALQRAQRPVADASYRSRLRAAFVSRSIPERRATRSWPLLRAPWPRVAASLIAAAAAMIVVLLSNAGPAWRLRTASGSGSLRVDGRVLDLASSDEISRALHGGARIELPADAQLDLELPGVAVFQLVGGSRLVLPANPGRWFTREVTGSLDTGEVRITTGPRFHGTRLAVDTPEMRAIVTGTTLAVLRQPDASCVCVLEGAVVMSGHASAPDTVHAGFRRQVFRDGRAPLLEPIRPMEIMKLQMLRAQLADSPSR